jgi:hypothetical protein
VQAGEKLESVNSEAMRGFICRQNRSNEGETEGTSCTTLRKACDVVLLRFQPSSRAVVHLHVVSATYPERLTVLTACMSLYILIQI